MNTSARIVTRTAPWQTLFYKRIWAWARATPITTTTSASASATAGCETQIGRIHNTCVPKKGPNDHLWFIGQVGRRAWTSMTLDKLDLEHPPEFTHIGKVEEEYEPVDDEAKESFAVVEISSRQFKVAVDDVIITETLKDVDVNDKISLERILLLGSKDQTIVGRPFITGSSVTAAVEEQFKDGKKIIFKKKRRNKYRRFKGHRQNLTALRILSINDNM